MPTEGGDQQNGPEFTLDSLQDGELLAHIVDLSTFEEIDKFFGDYGNFLWAIVDENDGVKESAKVVFRALVAKFISVVPFPEDATDADKFFNEHQGFFGVVHMYRFGFPWLFDEEVRLFFAKFNEIHLTVGHRKLGDQIVGGGTNKELTSGLSEIVTSLKEFLDL